MKKKSNKLNLIICGIAFIIMIVFLFIDGIDNIIGALGKMNPLFLAVSILCMVGYWFCEGFGLHLAAKSIQPKTRLKTSLLVAMIGQYFNCITPCATGGQPMQVYTYVSCGMPLGSAMTALLCRFIVYQLILTVYSVIFLVCKLPMFIGGEFTGLTFLVIIGFIVNTAVIVMLFMLAFFRKASEKIAHAVIKLCGRLRIIKDVEEKTRFVDEELEKYYENFLFIKKRPLLILKMCGITAVQLLLYFSITYVIYLGFGLTGSDLFTIIACQSFVLMISSFVPLPGAMGAAEGSYAAFFGGIFGKHFTVVSTFIWRFLTFYLPIIVGIVINLRLSKKGIDLSKSSDVMESEMEAEAAEERMSKPDST